MALLPFGTEAQYRAQRTGLYAMIPDSYPRVSLRRLMSDYEASPQQRPSLDSLPNGAYKEISAIAGLALERGIWPALRLWNQQNAFPYAYRQHPPDKLIVVKDLSQVPMPFSPRQRYRRENFADRGLASMFDIVDYHIRAWDKRVNKGVPSAVEGALDINTEMGMRSRFQTVSQIKFYEGEPIKEIQQLNSFISENAQIGLMIAWSLVDLIPYLYLMHFNAPPNAEAYRKTYNELIDSAMDDILIDLAGIASNVILGIEQHSFETCVGPRVSILPRSSGLDLVRYHFNAADFSLYQTEKGLKMYFSPQHLKKMKCKIPDDIDRHIPIKDIVYTGCPASIAKADGQQTIIKYILRWIKTWVRKPG